MNNDVFIINKNVKNIVDNVKLFPDDIKDNVPIDKIENVTLSNISEMIKNSSG